MYILLDQALGLFCKSQISSFEYHSRYINLSSNIITNQRMDNITYIGILLTFFNSMLELRYEVGTLMVFPSQKLKYQHPHQLTHSLCNFFFCYAMLWN